MPVTDHTSETEAEIEELERSFANSAPELDESPSADHAGQPAPKLFNPWIVAIVVTIGTFMEVLDTSIANVALPH
ncbi:MAG TPA: hypothetical protein VL346_04350, partial [Acidobacteriaceae bacterium]|nr:hypothetical protein [Acidobacteriaceae bacterium]